jgi:hypothetical protein
MHYQPSSLKLDYSIWLTTLLIHSMKMFVGLFSKNINYYFHLCSVRILNSVRNNWVNNFGDCYSLVQVQILEYVLILLHGFQIVLGLMSTGIFQLWTKTINWAECLKILCNNLINSKDFSIHLNRINKHYLALGTNSWTNLKNY